MQFFARAIFLIIPLENTINILLIFLRCSYIVIIIIYDQKINRIVSIKKRDSKNFYVLNKFFLKIVLLFKKDVIFLLK